MQLLVGREACLTSKTKNGLTPLHMAAQGDHVDCVGLLLHHGAPIDDVTVVSGKYLTLTVTQVGCSQSKQ